MTAARKNKIQLSDGRTLAWTEWGDANGHPILFCTGAGMSGSIGFGQDYLEKFGFRLIAIDRPGFGGSSPHPQKTLLSWCEDIKEFFASRDLPTASTVGFSQGSVFAFALAAKKRVRSVAIVSGQDDFSDPTTKSLLHKSVQGFVESVQSKNQEFLDGFSRMANAEGLWQLISAMSSAKDKELYESEAFQKLYQHSLQEGFSRGSEAYVLDLVNSMIKWPFDLEDIECPVEIFYGSLDSSTVHSPDFGFRMSKRIKHSSRKLFESEGGSLLWTQAEKILGSLVPRR